MHDFEDIVGRIGDTTDDLERFVSSKSVPQIRKLALSLSKSLPAAKQTTLPRFSFMANSALSGAGHPCSSIDCRIRKLNELAAFCSLYADHVVVEDPFVDIIFSGSSKYLKEEFIFAIQLIKYLSPLIEAKLISFASKMLNICTNCLETHYAINKSSIEKRERDFNSVLKKKFLRECSVTITKHSKSLCVVELSGPEELVNHGQSYIHVTGSDAKELIKQGGNFPWALTKKEKADLAIYEMSAARMVSDVSSLEMQSKYLNINILTDNDLQFDLLKQIHTKQVAANANNFSEAIRHSMPAILNADLNAILKLRKNESEAFSVYRDSLNALLGSGRKWEKNEVQEAFSDTVLPEVNKINKQVKTWTNGKVRSVGAKALVTAATVTAGFQLGILPTAYAEIIALLGGVEMGAACLDDILSTKKKAAPAQESDFYFLWRLNK
ncbi:MAG: hypothetical protein IT560_01060 [Alphaproteobacteria bacterium]|nr:hypothetical protein [Alphaproteobacteria bacterium]